MNRNLLLVLLALLCINGIAPAQSPNQRGAVQKIDASLLQLRSEKGAASGYAPLNGSSLLAPSYFYPSFGAAADGTFWVKSGSTMAAVTGAGYASGLWTANNVSIGLLPTGSYYGIQIGNGQTYPLYLRGGAGGGNQVIVDYGQTLEGVANDHITVQWSIGSGGGFVLSSGTFNGAISLATHAITGVTTIAGSVDTLDLVGSSLTIASGNFTFSMAGGAGVVVPSTGSLANSTFALNATAANALYPQLAGTNVFTNASATTFNAGSTLTLNGTVVFPTSGIVVGNAAGATTFRAGTGSQFLQRNAGNSDYVFNTISPVITLGTDLTGSVTLTNLTSGTLNATLNTVTVAKGGTGVTTLTGIPVASGTANFAAITGTANQFLQVNGGGAYTFATISPTITVTGDVSGTQTFTNLGNAALVLNLATPIPVAKGGTGGTTIATALTALGVEAEVVAAPSGGNVVTIDETLGQYFTTTLSANATLTITNHASGRHFYLKIKKTGNFTITSWDATVIWPSATPPTQTAGAFTDVFEFIDNGTKTLGRTWGLNYTE